MWKFTFISLHLIINLIILILGEAYPVGKQSGDYLCNTNIIKEKCTVPNADH